MKYKVYFEIFGKKMMTEVKAISPEAAKKIIRNKIIFHKIKEEEDILDHLKNIFGMK